MSKKTNLNIRLIVLILFFTTVVEAIGGTYVFLPGQSTVIEDGWFANIHEIYTIEGQFQLTIDFDANAASFDHVDANLSENVAGGYGQSFDGLFDMTDLVGIVVSDTEIEFDTVDPMPGGKVVHLDLTFVGNSTHLTGGFCEPWLEGFCYTLDAVAVASCVYYVDAVNGDDDNDGLTPETAFASIQVGIDAAVNGDEVVVSEGTYTGPGNKNLDFAGRAITARSKNGPELTIIDCQNDGRGFYFHSGEGTNSVLDGFTITNGYTDVPGGAIYCDGSSPTITNCIIKDNRANSNGGGGIYINEGSPTIVNCFISRNSAILGYLRGNGGGIYCSESSPTITNCTITDNLAGSEGGGIYNCSGPISNCIISDNYVSAGRGGGLCYCDGPITNCTITDNEAGQGGGLSYCDGVISNCSITNNWAYQGGGMHDCDGQIKNCTISKNIGGICGGGLEECDGLIINCVISGNRGHSFEMSMGWARGGGLYHCNGQINNCTITGNSFVYNGGGLYSCNGVISNCIIWNNDANENGQISNSSDPIYSCIENWSGGGIDNINEDPCFVDTGYWGDNGTPEDVEDDFWVKGDFHLKSQAGRWNPTTENWVIDAVTSPCVDAGNMSSPISYEPFPNGGRINMGAYGSIEQASKSYFGGTVCQTIMAGDINGDCKVDFVDFAILAGHWLWEE